MKQKKVKFTITGIIILVAFAVPMIIIELMTKQITTALWIAWMTNILGLIGVFTYGNSVDKRTMVNGKDNSDNSIGG